MWDNKRKNHHGFPTASSVDRYWLSILCWQVFYPPMGHSPLQQELVLTCTVIGLVIGYVPLEETVLRAKLFYRLILWFLARRLPSPYISPLSMGRTQTINCLPVLHVYLFSRACLTYLFLRLCHAVPFHHLFLCITCILPQLFIWRV